MSKILGLENVNVYVSFLKGNVQWDDRLESGLTDALHQRVQIILNPIPKPSFYKCKMTILDINYIKHFIKYE